MTVFDQIIDPANRANPYPLYAELRRTPVTRQDDGTWVVSTYQEIVDLLHDPRVSSDRRNNPQLAGERDAVVPAFIGLDPPEHDRLREIATRPFGPPHTPGRIDALRSSLLETTTRLIDGMHGQDVVDVVDQLAYPLPVSVICRLLGVPVADEPRFHRLADAIIESNDPYTGTLVERRRRTNALSAELRAYLDGLLDARRDAPGDDLLSAFLTDGEPDQRMSRDELLATAQLLLIAGHETTVNIITNGMFTLLRHPDVLDRLRREPDLSIGLVEELLRYEPPVQFVQSRVALADLDVAGTTIPAGSPITLVLAAGDRDPNRFPEPDRFDPDRTDNQHLGFGGGVHYCYGAALARLEAQVALTELARRLVDPRLVEDPPPYRPSPQLRGPRHLLVAVDGILPA
ncbi:MAG TPA: cytochrome P450 [Baekduia sp.]